MFNRVTILGVGLIGGSLGLAIRKRRLAKKVVGVCRTSRSVRLAREIGAIDWGTTDPVKAVRESDFVILATPISTIPTLVRRLAPHLKPGVLITDVASAKGLLVRELEKLLPGDVVFVGSHPMAGRETSGVLSARADLFQGKICFVTRRPKTSPRSLKAISAFWRRIGCRVKVVTVEEHDRLVASLSHLPHLLASLLVLNAGEVTLAGTGFRDMTRIVSSDPLLWQDIFLSNQKEILRSLGHFRKRLDGMTLLLKRSQKRAILKQLKQAKHLRDRLTR